MVSKISHSEFISIFSKVPRICVDLVIQTKEGTFLTKRAIDPWKGEWHLPGGSILFGETIENAVKRVAREELNLEVEPIKILGVIEFLSKLSLKRHSISLVFLIKIKSGEIKLNEQATEFIFTKIAPKNTIEEHKKFLVEKFSYK